MTACQACSSDVAEAARFCSACGASVDDRLETPTGTAPRGTPSPLPAAAKRAGSDSGVRRSSSRTSSSIAGQGRFEPGDLLAERYRIVALLGKGGMGEVYRADDLTLAQPVALKLLPQAFAEDPERLRRFKNEVSVSRQVSHPNVCRVYDIGEIAGEHYISMEFVDGEDLASLLRRIGRLPGDKALEISRQLCAGLAAAHDKGVLHRDLKPENVMLDGRGRVRITDFGLSSLVEQVAPNDVRSGTPAYMSPEQLTGREVTVRSDVYALGLVLFELFTGRRAFEGKSFVELLRKHENDPPPTPSELVTDLDPRVESVILRCLEKDPRRRPPSALAVAAALPGGDPLAAALAAGETPSPELVAAAGAEAGLSPRAAWGAAAFTLLVTLGYAFFAGREGILGYVTLPKPPVVLADQAREMIARIGYPEPPGDSAYAYSVDGDYIQWKAARDKSMERWRDLRSGMPPVVQLWYRQSPQPLISSALSGRVFWGNPPMLFTGMAGVRLDPRGNLLEFYAVPPQVGDSGPASAPDWGPLFAEAKLDRAQFKEVAPLWTPRSYADHRAAWEGPLPGRPDITIRVEAASHRGRPVWFELIAPWTRPSRMEPFKPTSGQLIAATVGSLLLVCGLVAGGALAWRNLRLGRVDHRGAAAVTGFALVVGMIVWALEADHLPEFNRELTLIMRGVATSLRNASLTGLLYLALEPYVRRLWPDALISWSRLMAGRWRDPLVAAHVLKGMVYGTATVLWFVSLILGMRAFGVPPDFPTTFSLDALLGPDQALMFALSRLVNSVGLGMGTLLLFVGMRFLLKRDWLATLAVVVIAALPDAFSSGTTPWLAVPASMVVIGILVTALVREGLLALITALFVLGLIVNLPQTLELGQWYSLSTKVVLAVVAALVGYGVAVAARSSGSLQRT